MEKVIKLYSLQPKQREFCGIRDKRYIAYGGARGGGKSFAVREKAVRLALSYEGIKILIIRKQFTDLRENHINPLRLRLEPIGFAEYKEKEKKLTCVNGSAIFFNFFSNDNDALQYQGQEFDIIFMEEATQFSEQVFDTLKACLRGANKFPKRMYLTCNPGGIGHSWVKRLFIDCEYKSNEDANDYTFVKALVYDNKILMKQDPAYVKSLESLPEGMRKQWLEGSWDLAEGRFFPEFSREIHVVEPFVIPDDWRVYRVVDYGLDRLACLWIAMDYKGCAYVIREIGESGLIVSEAAKKIKECTAETIYDTLLPGDLDNRHSDTGKSTRELFQEYGIISSIADNRRIQGWLDLKEWLRPFEDENGKMTARLKVFSTCRELIKNMCDIQFDEKVLNDAAVEPHELTHNTDALRYWAAGRPFRSIEKADKPRHKLIDELRKKGWR